MVPMAMTSYPITRAVQLLIAGLALVTAGCAATSGAGPGPATSTSAGPSSASAPTAAKSARVLSVRSCPTGSG